MLEQIKNRFDSISSYIFYMVIGLLPVFFLPMLNLNIEISKTYFLAFGLAMSFVFWIIGRMISGTISIPKNLFILSGFFILLIFFISSLFSPASSISFVGEYFEIGTFISILLFVGLFILGSYFVNSTKQISKLYFNLVIGFIAISLFQILYVFIGPKYLSLGSFYNNVSNMIGKWNDFGIYIGFMIIMGLLTYELLKLNKVQKIIISISLVISFFFLILVNFPSVWIVVGIFSLIIFIYSISVRNINEKENVFKIFPTASFLAVILCLLFILTNLSGVSFGGYLSSKIGLSQTEVRPSMFSTNYVILESLKESPILGVSPNRFMYAWSKYHTQDINNTQFWNANFSSGFSLIPSLSATTGILGIIGLLFFFVLFIWSGVKYALHFTGDVVSNYDILSTFVLALYLWIFSFIYNPGIVIITLAFVLSGAMIGLAITKGLVQEYKIFFLKDPRNSFFANLFLVILLLLLISSIYFIGERFAGAVFYSKISQIPNTVEGLDIADMNLNKAISFNQIDSYYRNLSLISLYKINYVLSQKDVSKDVLKEQLQSLLSRATMSSQASVSIDKTNIQNWITFGQVYQSVVSFDVIGSYDNAKQAYLEAKKLSPNNPGIELLLAKLELDNKNSIGARNHIDLAFKLKPNFTEAAFLLSQIEVNEGNISKAIERIESATLFDKNNSSLYFQLGLLKYNQKDFIGAVVAFEKAVILQPATLNNHYFLGLAYDKANRKNDALKQFELIATKVQDNQELNEIIADLKSGKSVLNKVNNLPEKARNLPVTEEKI